MPQLADCLPAMLKSPNHLEIGAISYRQDHGDLNDTIALLAEGLVNAHAQLCTISPRCPCTRSPIIRVGRISLAQSSRAIRPLISLERRWNAQNSCSGIAALAIGDRMPNSVVASADVGSVRCIVRETSQPSSADCPGEGTGRTIRERLPGP